MLFGLVSSLLTFEHMLWILVFTASRNCKCGHYCAHSPGCKTGEYLSRKPFRNWSGTILLPSVWIFTARTDCHRKNETLPTFLKARNKSKQDEEEREAGVQPKLLLQQVQHSCGGQHKYKNVLSYDCVHTAKTFHSLRKSSKWPRSKPNSVSFRDSLAFSTHFSFSCLRIFVEFWAKWFVFRWSSNKRCVVRILEHWNPPHPLLFLRVVAVHISLSRSHLFRGTSPISSWVCEVLVFLCLNLHQYEGYISQQRFSACTCLLFKSKQEDKYKRQAKKSPTALCNEINIAFSLPSHLFPFSPFPSWWLRDVRWIDLHSVAVKLPILPPRVFKPFPHH